MSVDAMRIGVRIFWERVLIAGAVSLACLALPGLGSAQERSSETQLELARRQYREGVSLEAAGDWALALKKFEAVARVRLTPQVRFHIGRNKENLGRLTEALGDYRLAEYEARDVSEDELRKIREARESLESRIPRLQVTADGSVAGATISLDGVEIGRDRLDQALPVDPGAHRVVVRFADGTKSEYVVQVVEGLTEVLKISGREPETPVPPAPAPAPAPAEPAPPPAAWWPWVAGGVGAAGIVGGSVMLYLRQDAIDTLEENCTSSRICREEYRSTYESGQTYSLVAPIALGVGVAGIGAAVLGFALRPEAEETAEGERSMLGIDVAVLPEQLGVSVSGEF